LCGQVKNDFERELSELTKQFLQNPESLRLQGIAARLEDFEDRCFDLVEAMRSLAIAKEHSESEQQNSDTTGASSDDETSSKSDSMTPATPKSSTSKKIRVKNKAQVLQDAFNAPTRMKKPFDDLPSTAVLLRPYNGSKPSQELTPKRLLELSSLLSTEGRDEILEKVAKKKWSTAQMCVHLHTIEDYGIYSSGSKYVLQRRSDSSYPTDDFFEAYFHYLQVGLDAHCALESGVFFRGIHVAGPLRARYLNDAGARGEINVVTSTSKVEAKARKFALNDHLDADERLFDRGLVNDYESNPVLFKIEGKAFNVESLSEFPDEKERIVVSGQTFVTKKISHDGPLRIVHIVVDPIGSLSSPLKRTPTRRAPLVENTNRVAKNNKIPAAPKKTVKRK